MGNAIYRKIQQLLQLNQLYLQNEEGRHKLRSFQACKVFVVFYFY